MQTRNKILDDISHLMTNAMGVAQGAKGEADVGCSGKGGEEAFVVGGGCGPAFDGGKEGGGRNDE